MKYIYYPYISDTNLYVGRSVDSKILDSDTICSIHIQTDHPVVFLDHNDEGAVALLDNHQMVIIPSLEACLGETNLNLLVDYHSIIKNELVKAVCGAHHIHKHEYYGLDRNGLIWVFGMKYQVFEPNNDTITIFPMKYDEGIRIIDICGVQNIDRATHWFTPTYSLDDNGNIYFIARKIIDHSLSMVPITRNNPQQPLPDGVIPKRVGCIYTGITTLFLVDEKGCVYLKIENPQNGYNRWFPTNIQNVSYFHASLSEGVVHFFTDDGIVCTVECKNKPKINYRKIPEFHDHQKFVGSENRIISIGKKSLIFMGSSEKDFSLGKLSISDKILRPIECNVRESSEN